MKTSPKLLRAAAFLPALTLGVLHAAEPVAPEPAKAEAPADGAPVQLEKTVVVASRREEKLAAASPSVSVVTRDEIDTRRLSSVSSVVAAQPGVEVSGAGGPLGSLNSVFTRGTNSDMTAVLIDGRKANPGFGNTYNLQRYSTAGLDSVQFQRGASSTLYGANALGGVIDLRTADPLRARKPTGALDLEEGKFGYRRVAVSGTAAATLSDDPAARNKLGVTVARSVTDTDGPVANADYHANDATVRVDARPVESLTFETLAQVQEANNGNPGAIGQFGGFPNLTDRQTERGWLISPGVRYDNHDDTTAHLFYSRSYGELDTKSAWGDDDLRVATQEVSLQVDRRLAAWASLSAGASFEEVSPTKVSNATGAETFARDWQSVSPWGRLTLHTKDGASRVGAGVRYQAFDDFKDATTGELFGAHAIAATDTTLHAKVASAYSTPHADNYAYGVPPVALKPQRSVGWEAGAKQRLFRKSSPLELGATVFENRITDILAWHQTLFATINGPEARTRGVELTADWLPVRQWKVYANATLLDARYEGDAPAYGIRTGDRLALRPAETVTVGTEIYPVDSVTLGLSGTGVMRREGSDAATFAKTDLGDYFVARAYGSWRFHKNAEVFGRVENLFDERYDAYNQGYLGMPLAAYAGVRLSF